LARLPELIGAKVVTVTLDGRVRLDFDVASRSILRIESSFVIRHGTTSQVVRFTPENAEPPEGMNMLARLFGRHVEDAVDNDGWLLVNFTDGYVLDVKPDNYEAWILNGTAGTLISLPREVPEGRE
jgi:Family of unknown function (DUF6188)